MEITLPRDLILEPFQTVAGAVARKPTIPILGHILCQFNGEQLYIQATDNEIVLSATIQLPEAVDPISLTVPARKFIDICRTLPADASLTLMFESPGTIKLQSGHSRFALATLPPEDFPSLDVASTQYSLNLPENVLKRLIDKTAFSMAQQDVRSFLNGMLFHIKSEQQQLLVVTADGHRLSASTVDNIELPSKEDYRVIVPRKGVLELNRLLSESNEHEVTLNLSSQHINIDCGGVSFVSKLLTGTFPDINRIIPKSELSQVTLDRDAFKEALQRVSILSSDKHNSVRFDIQSGALKIVTHNPDNEVAEEVIEAQLDGSAQTIGFNIRYLIDVLDTMPSGQVKLNFVDDNSSVLITHDTDSASFYVVMPMRL